MHRIKVILCPDDVGVHAILIRRVCKRLFKRFGVQCYVEKLTFDVRQCCYDTPYLKGEVTNLYRIRQGRGCGLN
jgi:hypothetical protein